MKILKFIPIFIFTSLCFSQTKQDLYSVINSISEKRIQKDIEKLVSFGTRHTLSDTISKSYGIGAARRDRKSVV